MKKIVLTGGPCAGKTTVVEALRKEFAAQILVVPEVATMLLSSGFPVPGKDLQWSLEWQVAFESAVLPIQIQLERAYELKAAENGTPVLVCDRGRLDVAANIPGGSEYSVPRSGSDRFFILCVELQVHD
jgi:predicted ATPase